MKYSLYWNWQTLDLQLYGDCNIFIKDLELKHSGLIDQIWISDVGFGTPKKKKKDFNPKNFLSFLDNKV